jgi:hypothetical protein
MKYFIYLYRETTASPARAGPAHRRTPPHPGPEAELFAHFGITPERMAAEVRARL